MLTLGTLAIWALSRSNNNTRRPYSDGFC